MDVAPGRARRRRPRRWLRWVALVVLVGAATLWLTRARWYGVTVEVVSPTRGPIAQTVVSSGRVLAPSRVEIGSVMVGVVERVYVVEGERVARGQALVALDDDEAVALVARAEAALAGVAAAEAELDERGSPSAGEALKRARARLAQAEADLARDSRLARDGALPETDLQRTKTQLTLARSEARAAEIEARSTRPAGARRDTLAAQRVEAQAALDGARARLASYVLSAPLDGIVVSRGVEPGAVVQPGAPLVVIAEAGRDRLVIEPDEKALGALALGQPAIASADAYPDRRFGATVSWLAPTIDPRRGTVEVHLALDAPQDFLKSDMTVSIEIEVATKADALVLPRAIVRDIATDAPWVMVVEGAHAQRRPVSIGLRGDALVEVTHGVDVDARVIVPGPVLPAEGARVRVAAPVGK